MNNFKERWSALPAKKKQAYGAMAILGTILVCVLVFSEEQVKIKKAPPKAELTLVDGSSSELDMEQLAGQNSLLKSQFDGLKEAFDRLSRQNDSLRQTISANDEITKTPQMLYDIQREMQALKKQMESNAGSVYTGQSSGASEENDFIDSIIDDSSKEVDAPIAKPTKPSVFSQSNKPQLKSATSMPDDPMAFVNAAYNDVSEPEEQDTIYMDDEDKGVKNNPYQSNSNIKIEVVSSDVDYVEEDLTPKEVEWEGAIIPAGSLISGVVISGVDAPTGKAAEKGAVASTMKITGPAILPNGERVDLDGCFMTFDVRGEAATERAHFRSQRLTCMFEAGIVDTAVQGYVSGKDGVEGFRGTLVNKQGKALAYAAGSGFIGGFGKAFASGGGNSGVVFSSGEDQYELPEFSDAATAGAAQGIGDSSDMLMEYYQEQLNLLYPVIEIKPMIFGSIHVMSTVQLKLFKASKKTKGA